MPTFGSTVWRTMEGRVMAHTPAPWEISQSTLGAYSIHAVAGPVKVCPAIAHGLDDACLIAAAPDLLLAVKCLCEEMVDYMTINKLGDPNEQHNYRLGMAAIAKAERT